MTKKDTLEIKAFILINLLMSESTAAYKIYYNLDDPKFWSIFMVFMFALAIILWDKIKYNKDKQIFIDINIIVLPQNIILMLVAILGDESIWSIILYICSCILLIVSFVFLYKKYRRSK